MVHTATPSPACISHAHDARLSSARVHGLPPTYTPALALIMHTQTHSGHCHCMHAVWCGCVMHHSTYTRTSSSSAGARRLDVWGNTLNGLAPIWPAVCCCCMLVGTMATLMAARVIGGHLKLLPSCSSIGKLMRVTREAWCDTAPVALRAAKMSGCLQSCMQHGAYMMYLSPNMHHNAMHA